MKQFRATAAATMTILSLLSCAEQDKTEKADVKAQMAQHVQPTAQVYWEAVQYISDEQGAREIVPTTDEEWNRTVEAARTLRTLAETLKQPEYAADRGTDWQDFAQGMVEASSMAEAAARSRQPDKVLEAGGVLYNVCSACHEVYLTNPVRLAPDLHNETGQ